MMLPLYVFFLTFQIIGTIMCAVLCYKIAYLRLTPTLTWLLFFFAFVIRFITQINSIFYIHDIIKFVDQYNMSLTVISQILSASFITLLLVAILRVYKALKENGIAS